MSRLEYRVSRAPEIELRVDGSPVLAYPGETLAAALVAAGRRAFRRTAQGDLRGPFCNMGVCFECVVTVDGVPNVRACMTTVRPGMAVETGISGGAS
jgi:predicted molibdopterin-dependent oxidoreductase YjgC